MINPASQPQCTSRAEWCLQTGKAAKTLSPHYRLGCDFGTAVIVLWKEGGGEPIYVCDSHAKQLGRSREHFQEARIITAVPEQTDTPAKSKVQSQTPVKSKDRAPTQGVTVPDKKSQQPVLPEAAPVVAEATEAKAPKEANPVKTERTTVEVREKPSVRDLTYGNPAKAMVDEAIWNMATGNYQVYRAALSQGKSSSEAAEAAGGQLAFIHRKISDYTQKLETMLSTSQATINVEETVDRPLEKAMSDAINNDVLSESEKDAVIEQLGALQGQLKQGLQERLTLLQANGIMLAIGDRVDWGGNSQLSENFKTVCRTLYSGLRTALCTAAPEAQNLHERLTNLYAAKSEMEAR